jgi:uncharacterized repeat protein (TIGR01451 family)
MQKQPRLRLLTKTLCVLALSLAASSCSNTQLSDEPEVEVGKISEALFSNGDFEAGPQNAVPTGWTLNTYINGGVTASQPPSRSMLTLSAGGTAQTRNLYSATGAETQADVTLGTGASLRWPKFGNYAAYINMNPGNGGNVNALRQTMVLGVNDVDPYDGKPHIRFAVAPVMENPSPAHTPSQQPYYFIQLKNTTTNTVLFTDYHYSEEPGVPWKTLNAVGYTDWQLKDIAPTSTQAALGDSIELEIMASSCQPTGHFGRIYMDGVGPTIPGLSVNASAPAAANSNTNITYDLVFKNGGTGAAGNVVIDFNTPPSTTFQSLSAPGAVCTQPSANSAGLVSCTYGLLEIGASNSLQITVKINNGATGIVTAGNYQISAVNAQALLGNTVYTSITSGVTYTDVTVSNTNHVGAVNWGQAVTYKIVATNDGPAAITGGTMVDTLPSTLTGATWTCAGTNSGTCAAAGSGNINDNTVNLPVGASVTYTLNATLAASGVDTRLRNIATFTLPGAMADSQSSDNSAADTDPITTTSTLTLTKAGNATGTVVSVPNAFDCGTGCTGQSGTFAQNQPMILAATPAAGKIFTGWSGACTGTGNCTLTLATNAAVTATFDSPPPCAADSECSATRYCDGVSLTCQPRLPNGTNIPNDGIHTGTCSSMGLSCASLLCNSNKCAKSAGASCTTAVECASNACTSGTCAKMPNGSECGLNSDCTSASCKSQHCVPASGCYADADCSNTQYCHRSTYTCTTKLAKGTQIPTDTLHTGVCGDAAAVCQSGLCNSATTTCGLSNGGDCTTANQCQNNTCTEQHCVPSSSGCYVDSNCTPGNYCDRAQLSCVPKLTTGTAIPSDGLHINSCNDAPAVCQTGFCNPTAKTCAENNGTTCASASVCISNTCKSGYCVPTNDGCYVDNECGPGSYCDRSILTCVTKLPAATALPNDGLHTNVCNPDNATAVCQSGKCNTSTLSCATDNGTTCAGVSSCVSNTCTSQHCVPETDGCWVDGDCANGNYCNRATFTCTPALPPGTAIPTDGLHTGSCTESNQVVCASLECNSTTNTCASPSSTICNNANQCVSNACSASSRCVPSADGCFVDSDCSGGNKYCDRTSLTCVNKLQPGTAIPSDGLHGGMCIDASAVCRSSECNQSARTCAVADGTVCNANNQCITNTCTSNHCVPATDGCWQDSDCGDGSYCDRTTLSCTQKLTPGQAIPNDGLHGGGCADASAVCQSAQCNPQSKTCATADGTGCNAAAQCVSNACTSDHCVPSSDGCWLDPNCAADKYCDRSTLTCAAQLEPGSGIPDDGLHGGACSAAVAVCVSDKCNSTTSTCALDNGATCDGANDCVNNTCTSEHCVASSDGCYVDSDCAEGSYCDRGVFQCKSRISDGGNIPTGDGYHPGDCGAASALCTSGKCNATALTCASDSNVSCSAAAQCTNNVCDPNGKCGIDNGGSGCTPGDGASLCQSGTCAPSNRCVPSGGDGCYVDSDCSSDKYCERSSLTCKPKLNDGTAIPRDGLHDGRCTQPNAQATCVSAGCNAVTNTCASNNGTSCSAANQCIRNICGSNSECGIADGAGPCNQTNAKFVCQSGACSSTGNVCVPALNKSCAADSDCPSASFCDALSATCTPDLSNSQNIPSDGLHDGLCNPANAQAVCTSGSCNSATNQCAAPIAAACINAAECAANVCGDNGKCGRADGAGPCTSSNATTLCQSGSCSQDGTCIEAGHCKIDADCLPNRYCDRTISQCSERLPAGMPIPSDGYHDGSCPSSGLTPVCSSGSCSVSGDTCVVENGASCSADEECASGSCGSNGLCGLEDEANGCTPGADSSCQSGVCDNGGTCAQAVTCSSDVDCAGDGAFCGSNGCQPRLPPGAAIPDDTLHAGSCTDPNAAAVCESGLCNTTSNTCADELDTSCGVAAQCESNICGANGRCGLPNGAGPCTPIDAAERCQSQTCSAVKSICIAASGCGADSECASNEYCDGQSFTCVSRRGSGTVIPDDGLHEGICTEHSARVCESGGCNPTTNTCALANGESCAGPAECAGNVCASDGKCGATNGTGHCTPDEASHCRSDTCSASSLTCIPQVNGCASANDCSASKYCNVQTYTCEDRVDDGEPLPQGTSCPSSGVTRDCASGLCLQEESRCVAPQREACTADEQCQSGVCGQNNQCGVEKGGACTPENAMRCQSQHCGDEATCQPEADCIDDADCAAEGGYCDGIICHPKLSAGQSVAADSLHDGKCTEENAQATCLSGACNDTTDTCAGAVSAACADPSACVSNACGSDGKCGYEIGEGPCTSLNATTVCRTGLCSVVGVCLPSQTSGCAVDSDCNGDSFCDLFQHACVPKLNDGASLPSDGLHDGICSLQSGAILCASGTCNPDTDTCARPNGVSCVSATTCISNVCGSNGSCGTAKGDGPCLADISKCQSNRCSPTQNVCIRSDNGCAADADCSNTSYCDPAARICKSKLAVGDALPNDSLHNGTCSSALAASVCQTGLCNVEKKTCAAINGASCDAANKCVSDACGSNSRCGLAVGQSGCTGQNQAQTCQSSYCSASGTCVPPQGCNLDSDCSGDTYCNRTAHVCEAQLRDGRSLPKDALHDGTCSAALADVVCASGTCNSTTNTCAAVNTAGCNDAAQCVSNVCGSNRQCGLGDGQSPCESDAQCQSGKCQLDSGRCVAGDAGCTRDEDCPIEDHCNSTLFRCEADLDDGTSLPGDSDSGGRCTSEVAKLCASGACNPETDACASVGGNECSEDSQCASNACIDGRCGSPDGAGECTQQNAASVCQSGICQADLYRCVAVKNGCTGDADCAAGTYCDGRSLACVPRLYAGAKLPSDDMHASTCSADVATAVCESGACNARTNACALVVGMPCAQANECASNACLHDTCVAESVAPPAFRLTGGRCSVTWVQAGSIGPTLALLGLGLVMLRRRARGKPKR